MELLDTDGKPLTGKSREEVINILKTVQPKNKEEEKLLAMAVGQKVEEERKKKFHRGLKTGFNKTFHENTKLRMDNDGYSPKRTMRLIASIPPEIAYIARQVWGDDVFTNKEKFNEAFVKDELGRLCLTVDPKSI